MFIYFLFFFAISFRLREGTIVRFLISDFVFAVVLSFLSITATVSSMCCRGFLFVYCTRVVHFASHYTRQTMLGALGACFTLPVPAEPLTSKSIPYTHTEQI